MFSVPFCEGATLMELPSDLFPGDSVHENFRMRMCQALRDTGRLIVDCSRVRVFGGSVLGLLLSAQQEAGPGDIVLCALPPLAEEVLRVTHLADVWPIYASPEEALEELGAPVPIIVGGCGEK